MTITRLATTPGFRTQHPIATWYQGLSAPYFTALTQNLRSGSVRIVEVQGNAHSAGLPKPLGVIRRLSIQAPPMNGDDHLPETQLRMTGGAPGIMQQRKKE
jgi:hypothetical protein